MTRADVALAVACACTGLTLERATAGMLVQLGGWLPIVRYEAGSLSAGLDGDGV